MKIILITRPELVIEVETREEANDAITCYMRDLDHASDEYISRIRLERGFTLFRAPAYRSSLEHNGGWVAVEYDATEWLKPYFDQLEKYSGCKPFPIDFTPVFGGIYHTHVCTSAKFDGTKFVVQSYGIASTGRHDGWFKSDDKPIDPEGRKKLVLDPVANVTERDLKGIMDKLAHVSRPQEYKETRNGLYTHDPNYFMKKPSYRPGVVHEETWQHMLKAFRDEKATPGQAAALDRYDKVQPINRYTKHLPTLTNYQGFHTHNYHTLVTWEAFRNL
jgi:hypothetical protein